MTISIIVAVSENNVIGKDNKLPWHLPADLKHFKNLTMGHHIIMGRKTYESIGKPLPGRTTVIITRNREYQAEGCIVVNSLQEAIEAAKKNNDAEAFIIGGAEIINQSESVADKIYLTKIHEQFEGDVFLHLNEGLWEETERMDFNPDGVNNYGYSFMEMRKRG